MLSTMSYNIFCTLKLISPKDLINTKHILKVDKGKGPQNPR